MFPLKRSSKTNCVYCGFVASSANELLTRHICYRTLHAQNVAQQSSRTYRPSFIKRTKTQALESLRLPSARQNNLKNSLSKDVRNDSRGKKKFMMNLSKVHYGYKPPITLSNSPQSIPSPSWREILDESEIPVSVLECGRKNKLNNKILDQFEMPVPGFKYIKNNEFLNERNNISRNNDNFIPNPVPVYRRFPSNFFLKRVSSRPSNQLLEKSKRHTTVHSTEKRISPVNNNYASSTQLTSSFYDIEPLSMDTVLGSEFSSEPMNVMLTSSINKEITIVSLDNVVNEIEKRMKRLPYKIRLQLEHEFLQKLQDSVDEEERKMINAV